MLCRICKKILIKDYFSGVWYDTYTCRECGNCAYFVNEVVSYYVCEDCGKILNQPEDEVIFIKESTLCKKCSLEIVQPITYIWVVDIIEKTIYFSSLFLVKQFLDNFSNLEVVTESEEFSQYIYTWGDDVLHTEDIYITRRELDKE